MTLRKISIWICVCFFVAWLWSAIASGVYLASIGFLGDFKAPWLEWWIALHYAIKDGWAGWATLYVWFWLVTAAATPSIPIIAVLTRSSKVRKRLTPSIWRKIRPIERGVTDNHGHADWMSKEQAQDLFPGPQGLVVGENFRVDLDPKAHWLFRPEQKDTWGESWKAPLLIDPCTSGSTNSIVFDAPGGGKTASAVTRILLWPGSCVVLDPSCEIAPMVEKAMKSNGKAVKQLGFGDSKDAPKLGINVLDWININNREAEMHVKTVVSWIYDEESASKGDGTAMQKDAFFTPMGKDLVTCFLAHLLWDNRPGLDKSLRTLRSAISAPESAITEMLQGIASSSRSKMARDLARGLMETKADVTFSGVCKNAYNGTNWLSVEAYAGMVSDRGIDPQDILSGDTAVFLQPPLETLITTPAIGRVVVGALLNTAYQANGDVADRILFLIDEAARLGALKALELARDTGRKYGVTLHLLYQSFGQFVGIWGEKESDGWLESVSWCGYGQMRAGATGAKLSQELGTYAVKAYSEGDNSGSQRAFAQLFGSRSKGRNVNVHEIKRKLAEAHELAQDMRADEMIVIVRGAKPIRCSKPIYFRRPEINKLVERNRFVKEAA